MFETQLKVAVSSGVAGNGRDGWSPENTEAEEHRTQTTRLFYNLFTFKFPTQTCAHGTERTSSS